jgi:hypothetical protein
VISLVEKVCVALRGQAVREDVVDFNESGLSAKEVFEVDASDGARFSSYSSSVHGSCTSLLL